MLDLFETILFLRLYLLIALIFILAISILLTVEIYKIFNIFILIFMMKSVKSNNKIYLVIYALQRQCIWLSAISLLEFMIDNNSSDKELYNIALCYQQLNLLNMAAYYYRQVSKSSTYYNMALKKLSILNLSK